MKLCRFPNCYKSQHRFELCNKHRKWVERGHMTENLVMLRVVSERGKYKYATCKIESCQSIPRRNSLCNKHSSLARRGKLTVNGTIKGEVRIRYPDDFQCIACGKTGKISKGFCKKHYDHFRKGIIDFDGKALRAPKRVARYGAEETCRADRCEKRPRVRGWCEVHYTSFDKGIYDEKGKRLVAANAVNKGRTCLECDQPAHCKGLCTLHYTRVMTGYLGPAGFKNVGQKCTALGCDLSAHCRTLCVKHYRRRLDRERKFYDSLRIGQDGSKVSPDLGTRDLVLAGRQPDDPGKTRAVADHHGRDAHSPGLATRTPEARADRSRHHSGSKTVRQLGLDKKTIGG